jgi:hypothetical protein
VNVLAASQGVLDQPGTVAFLVIFGMGVILFFVFRSMAKHLRKVQMAARAEAEAEAAAKEAEKAQTGAGGSDAEGPGGGFA